MACERWLNLELCDSTGAPLAGRPFVLTLADGSRHEGTLDENGCLAVQLPGDCRQLALDVAQRRLELEVVGLAPCSTILGAQERLNHLNYFSGEPDGELGPVTLAALRRFQRDQRLPVSAELDAATIARLLEEHGS